MAVSFGLLDDDKHVWADTVHIDVKIVESISHVCIKAAFRADHDIESAVFRAPLDDTRSAVTGLTLRSRSRGVVKAFVKPDNHDESGDSRGRRRRRGRGGRGGGGGGGSGRGDRQRDQFELKVGKVLCGETVNLEWTYVSELPVLADRIMLTLPQDVSFTDCMAQVPVNEEDASSDAGPEAQPDDGAPSNQDEEMLSAADMLARVAAAGPGDDTDARLRVTVSVSTGQKPVAVRSLTHADAVLSTEADEAKGEEAVDGAAADVPPPAHFTRVQWTAPGGLDGNFVVEVDMGAAWVPRAVVEENTTQGTAAVMVPILPRLDRTAPATTDDVKKKDLAIADGKRVTGAGVTTAQVVFVVDRSGSMSGGKFKAVQACMAELLSVMPPTAAFNVVSFGSRHEDLFGACLPATQENLDRARVAISRMTANLGGTNLTTPLRYIYGAMGDPEKFVPHLPMQLIVLTDGQVISRNRVINEVRTHCDMCRCFTFGIGGDVDGELVKGMAFAGKGRSTFVGGSARLLKKAARRLAKALQRSWCGVSVSVASRGPPGRVLQAPSIVAPTMDGEFEAVYALSASDVFCGDDATIRFFLDGAAAQLTVPAVSTAGRLPAGTVVRLAAREHIKDLESAGGSERELRARIQPTSVVYGLASRFATFHMPTTASADGAAGGAARDETPAPQVFPPSAAVDVPPSPPLFSDSDADSVRSLVSLTAPAPPVPAPVAFRAPTTSGTPAQAVTFAAPPPLPPSAAPTNAPAVAPAGIARSVSADSASSLSSSSSSDDDSEDSCDSVVSMASRSSGARAAPAATAAAAPPTGHGFDEDSDSSARYAVSYRSCSDSSSEEEDDGAPLDPAFRTSTAARTVTWQPRARRRAPVQWGASTSSPTGGGRRRRGGGGASAATSRIPPRTVMSDLSVCSSDSSDSGSESDSDSDISVTRVSSRSPTPRTGAGGAAGAGARGRGARSQPKLMLRQAALLQRSNGSFIPDASLATVLGLQTAHASLQRFLPSLLHSASLDAARKAEVDDATRRSIFVTALVIAMVSQASLGTSQRALVDKAVQWLTAQVATLPDDAPLRAFAVQALAPPASVAPFHCGAAVKVPPDAETADGKGKQTPRRRSLLSTLAGMVGVGKGATPANRLGHVVGVKVGGGASTLRVLVAATGEVVVVPQASAALVV